VREGCARYPLGEETRAMKFISYNGEKIALFLAPPNWADAVNVELTLPFTEITTAISAQESRRTFGKSARYSLEYSVAPGPDPANDAAFSTNLRLWLQRLKEEMVAVPMWTDAVEIAGNIAARNTVIPKTAANPVRYGAEWIVVRSLDIAYTQLLVPPDPGASLGELEPQTESDYEILVVTAIDDNNVTLASPGLTHDWADGTLMFPLLFGTLAQQPSFEAETDELLNGRIKFQENSLFARKLNVFPGAIPVVGAGIPEFSTKPLFDIQPDESVKSIDTTEIDIFTKQIGFLRQEQRQVYPQYVRRGQELNFYQDGRDQIARIERILTDRNGPVKTFMVPTFRGDVRFTLFDELLAGPEPGTAIEPG
jgi:hypothetical protein